MSAADDHREQVRASGVLGGFPSNRDADYTLYENRLRDASIEAETHGIWATKPRADGVESPEVEAIRSKLEDFSDRWFDAREKREGHNNGGSTDYYRLPEGATELQDLIEHKEMNFSQGNMFKAVYRMGNCSHSDAIRDLNKIIWYAGRELARLEGR